MGKIKSLREISCARTQAGTPMRRAGNLKGKGERQSSGVSQCEWMLLCSVRKNGGRAPVPSL